MNSKTYSIVLADGTVLSGLTRPTNAFVSEEPIDLSVFEGNLSPVVISDGENEETHTSMKLVAVPPTSSGAQRFILRDMSPEELKQMETDSKIDYIAMMAGVEL